MSIERAFTSIFSDDLDASRDFFVQLFGWHVEFDSDWFVHLQAPDNPAIELGIIRRDHEIVPAQHGHPPMGCMITIVVPDVDTLHESCVDRGVDILEAPRDLFYGQRRMVVREPSGALVDISSECDPSPEFLAQMRGGG